MQIDFRKTTMNNLQHIRQQIDKITCSELSNQHHSIIRVIR